ncbi:MAG TPA: FAD-dependent oxidoreductase [Terracidiphilus sp.]|nr:FAD-dependent oxidoreductase [Terracidiphilus sp.]
MAVKVAIIGGGIVGLATAHQLPKRHPAAKVLVLEKVKGAGQHQTGHNSGVLHCGLYYKPGSTKARMAVEGIRRMTAFCQQHGVHLRCMFDGKAGPILNPLDAPEFHVQRTLAMRRGRR